MGEAVGVGADGLLRVGVVGVGVMGSNHARVLSEMSGVQLAGIVDPDRKQRDLVTRAVGCLSAADLGTVENGIRAILEL